LVSPFWDEPLAIVDAPWSIYKLSEALRVVIGPDTRQSEVSSW